MAKIKHIAIRTADPEKTAVFYQELFGLKKAGLGRNGIYLTDGHVNLAILKGGDRLGIEHLGFQVDDVDATLANLNRLGGKSLADRVNVTPTDASDPQSYYEIKCVGPDGQIIDVSGSGWVGTD
ncbi:MAG TPA: VOC family protein [Candidatus Binatia bacterium]